MLAAVIKPLISGGLKTVAEALSRISPVLLARSSPD